MFRFNRWSLALLLTSTTVFAAATRTIDDDQLTSSDHSKTWSMPAATDTLLGRVSIDTVTNKSMSGASNTFTAIPAATALSGIVGVPNGGTGLATLTTGAIYAGNGTSAMTSLGAPGQYNVLTAVTAGNPVWGSVNLAQSAAVSGTLGVANGGVGLASGTSGGILGYTASGVLASSGVLTANAIVLGGGAGATPSVLASLGTATTILHGNAAGAPTFSAVALATDVSGQLPIANGGTGAATATLGFLALAPSVTGNAGKFLTTDGTNITWGTVSATAPTVAGTGASPSAITAAGGISVAGGNYFNIQFITGSGGAVTVTASPQITAGTAVGQQLILVGNSATNTVTLSDGTGLSLNGTWVGGNNAGLTLVWNGTVWTEVARR